MNILIRFRDIMSSNIHALLDKAEDPEKMINSYMRNLQSDLGKVKSEAATMMAEEQRANRALNECAAEMNKLKMYAIKALESNNEVDARKFLEKKATLAAEEVRLKAAYEVGASNTSKMREMHDKLISDMGAMESRLDMLKGELSVAKTQETMNIMKSSTELDTMEDKVNLAMDTANAVAELNSTFDDVFINRTTTYMNEDTNIDNELQVLKESIKKT